jgi:hypothetical protein
MDLHLIQQPALDTASCSLRRSDPNARGEPVEVHGEADERRDGVALVVIAGHRKGLVTLRDDLAATARGLSVVVVGDALSPRPCSTPSLKAPWLVLRLSARARKPIT